MLDLMKSSSYLDKEINNFVKKKLTDDIIDVKFIEYYYDNSEDVDDTYVFTIKEVQNKTTNQKTKDAIAYELLGYALFANMIGDYGFTEEKIKTDVIEFKKTIKNALEKKDKKEEEKLLNELINRDTSFATPELIRGNAKTAVEPLKALILNGLDDKLFSDTSILSFKAPRFAIIGGKTSTNKAQDKNYTISATTLSTKPFFNSSKDFPGVIIISKCSVYNTFFNFFIF